MSNILKSSNWKYHERCMRLQITFYLFLYYISVHSILNTKSKEWMNTADPLVTETCRIKINLVDKVKGHMITIHSLFFRPFIHCRHFQLFNQICCRVWLVIKIFRDCQLLRLTHLKSLILSYVWVLSYNTILFCSSFFLIRFFALGSQDARKRWSV